MFETILQIVLKIFSHFSANFQKIGYKLLQTPIFFVFLREMARLAPFATIPQISINLKKFHYQLATNPDFFVFVRELASLACLRLFSKFLIICKISI